MLEQSSQPLKVALLILLAALIFVSVLFILGQRGLLGKSALVPQPFDTTDQSQTETTTAPPVSPSASVFEEAGKQAGAIQDQVNAGTLSPEEAKKQLDVIGAQLPTPPLPPEVKE